MNLKYTYLLLLIALSTSCSKDDVFQDDDTALVFDEISAEDAQPTEIENQLFQQVNDYRKSKGLSYLTFEANTYLEAKKHNTYMISTGKRTHANFKTRAEKLSKKVGAKAVAENLASDYISIDGVLADWVESNGHRTNMEGDFTHSALSISLDANGTYYFTQMFYR